MSKTYPISTIEQMAAIPEDRLSAFLEELPDILKAYRDTIRFLDELGAKGNLHRPSWTDDGDAVGTVAFFTNDASGAAQFIGAVDAETLARLSGDEKP